MTPSKIWLLGGLVAFGGCEEYRRQDASDDMGAAGKAAAPSAGSGAAPGAAGTSSGGSGAGGTDITSGGLPPSVKCDAEAGEEPPLVSRTFSPTDEDFLNPERGFHADMPLPQNGLEDY